MPGSENSIRPAHSGTKSAKLIEFLLPGMSSGFTLIELLVVLAVTGMMSAAVLVAYPYARAEQKLTLAEQTLQAALRAAQQAAINEERDDSCVARVRAMVPPVSETLCSNIGVVVHPAQESLVVFADIDEPAANQFNSNRDFILSELAWPTGVSLEPLNPPTVLIFKGTPPTITLWSGVREVTDYEPVTLRIGQAMLELHVGSYGQVERRSVQ